MVKKGGTKIDILKVKLRSSTMNKGNILKASGGAHLYLIMISTADLNMIMFALLNMRVSLRRGRRTRAVLRRGLIFRHDSKNVTLKYKCLSLEKSKKRTA